MLDIQTAPNKAGGIYPLQAGDILIGLKAYLQGEPEAIAKQTIGRGAFSGGDVQIGV